MKNYSYDELWDEYRRLSVNYDELEFEYELLQEDYDYLKDINDDTVADLQTTSSILVIIIIVLFFAWAYEKGKNN